MQYRNAATGMRRRIQLGVLAGTMVGLLAFSAGCERRLSNSAQNGLRIVYERSVSAVVDVVADEIEQNIRK